MKTQTVLVAPPNRYWKIGDTIQIGEHMTSMTATLFAAPELC